MSQFIVGDNVVIRHGQHKGEAAVVVGIQRAEVYHVRFSDGLSLFFSRSGLQRADSQPSQNRLRDLPSLISAQPGTN